ncbi:N-acetylmuramoyl-L-alanine amidase family protein [Pedobacter sp. SAFR-022]|uniref:N-acetylmuramoyl-L-alanine amidase family protein n=1 Tax=Pedobacter sp. SAFR-022 TaxID=3436861 RepID=UPI003F7FB09D
MSGICRKEMRKYFRFFVCTLLAGSSLAVKAQGENYRVKTIVIDPGHGGNKPGARGSFSTEKNVALEVALKLGKRFEEDMPEMKVLFTRKTDVDVDFLKRAAIANNAKADLFISIHCNSVASSRARSTYGTETFVAGLHRIDEQNVAIRENADIKLEKNYKEKYDGYDPNDPETFIILSLFRNNFRAKSTEIAKLIQSNYEKNDRINRGVKEQGLLILQRAGMPAVLTEIGFISNPAEEKYMNSEKGQNEIVDAIFNAVKKYKQQNE